MKRIYSIAILLGLVLSSCNSKPSLQKYFVEKTESNDFIALDLASGILNIDEAQLSIEEKEALASFDKMNILAFKTDETNASRYDAEKAEVLTILNDEKYQELIRFGSGKDGGSIRFVGDDNHIEEFVVFANQKENGFALIRILGKDMNPNSVMTMLSVIKNSNIDMKQLQPLQEMFLK